MLVYSKPMLVFQYLLMTTWSSTTVCYNYLLSLHNQIIPSFDVKIWGKAKILCDIFSPLANDESVSHDCPGSSSVMEYTGIWNSQLQILWFIDSDSTSNIWLDMHKCLPWEFNHECVIIITNWNIQTELVFILIYQSNMNPYFITLQKSWP